MARRTGRHSNELSSLRVTYKGKNSRSCSQTIKIRNWTTSSWTLLDKRTVGPSETRIRGLVPPGSLADYISGSTGNGKVWLQVGCQTSTGSFQASGNLMKATYA